MTRKSKPFLITKSETGKDQVEQQSSLLGKMRHNVMSWHPSGVNSFADYDEVVLESSPRDTRQSPIDKRDISTVTSSVSHGGDLAMRLEYIENLLETIVTGKELNVNVESPNVGEKDSSFSLWLE